jgi:hypothetical protein
MKKLIAYMILATVVYLLIYALLLGALRMQSADISDYCESVQINESVPVMLARAEEQGLISAFQQMAEKNSRLLFVSAADNKDAVCKVIIENDAVKQKKFILSLF